MILARFILACQTNPTTIAWAGGTLQLRLTNPTWFPADVRVLSETAARAAKPLAPFPLRNARVIHLDPGGSVTARFR